MIAVLPPRQHATEADFLAWPDDGLRHELVKGEITTMAGAGAIHGCLGMIVGVELTSHVERHQLGMVFCAQTGYRMKNRNVRCPDVGFMSRERFSDLQRLPEGFLDGAPDLAVEILSPGNSLMEIDEKIADYFDSGCRLAWVINTRNKTALVYREPAPERIVRLDEELDGEDVLPGFKLPLARLFAGLKI